MSKVNWQDLIELIDRKIAYNKKTVSEREIEDAVRWFPKERYNRIYAWYKRGTGLMASLMNEGKTWDEAYEIVKQKGFRILRKRWDAKTKTGWYEIITEKPYHHDYEGNNEHRLETQVTNKYTLTEDLKLTKRKKYIQLPLEKAIKMVKKDK